MNINMNKNNSIRTILSAALLIAASATAFAQGNGLAGINEATSMVTSISTQARNSSTPSAQWSDSSAA